MEPQTKEYRQIEISTEKKIWNKSFYAQAPGSEQKTESGYSPVEI